MEAAAVEDGADLAVALVPWGGRDEDVVHQFDDAVKARERFFSPLAEPVPGRAEDHRGDCIGVKAPREEELRP